MFVLRWRSIIILNLSLILFAVNGNTLYGGTPLSLQKAAAGDYYSLQRVVQALRRNGVPDKQIVKSLSELLVSCDSSVRRKAALSLKEIGNSAKPAVGRLADLALEDSEPRVRAAAVLAVGTIGGQDYVHRIGNVLLCDESVHVRAAAASALASASTRDVVPYLLAAFHDQDDDVRAAAVGSLAQLGSLAVASVPSLVALLETNAFRQSRISTDVSYSVPLRYDVIETLGAIGPSAEFAVPYLKEILEADEIDAGVRLRAAGALIQISENTQLGLTVLGEMLKQENVKVKADTLTTLGALGRLAAPLSDLLVSCFEDEDVIVRSSAVSAVAETGVVNDQVLDALHKALLDPDIIVAGSAISALAKVVPSPRQSFLDRAFGASYRHREDPLVEWLRGQVGEAMLIAVGQDAALHYLRSRFSGGTKAEQAEAVQLISWLELPTYYEICVLRDLLGSAMTDVHGAIRERIDMLRDLPSLMGGLGK